MRRLVLVVAVIAVAIHALAASALADYLGVGSFSGAGSADGELSSPGKAAVRVSDGWLFVADTANDRVQAFSATANGGTYEAQFGAGVVDDPSAVAVDQATGAVYVADGDDIVKFDSSLDQVGAFASPGVTGPLAIDSTNGDLLVADQATNTVRRYASNGTPDDSFDATGEPGGAFTGLLDLAVDSTGDIVVVDSSGDVLADVAGASSRVERYTPAGEHEATVGPVDGAGSVTIDPDGDRVIVAGRFHAWNSGTTPRLSLFAPDGTSLATVDVPDATYAVAIGLAAAGDGSSRVYAVTKDPYDSVWGPTRITVIEDVPAPEVTDPASSAVTATSAHVSATVDPNGYPASWRFEYSSDGNTWTPSVGSTTSNATTPVTVENDLTDLQPLTEYRVRLVADNPVPATSNDHTLTTLAAPPVVGTSPAGDITSQTAKLTGTLDPQGSSTTYHFEYGTTPSYGTDVPVTRDTDGGAGNAPIPVFRRIAGLTPHTTYHYRLIATNAEGTVAGPDRTFTTHAQTAPTDTIPIPGPGDIPGKGYLPNDRAWEKVSPVDKGDLDVTYGAFSAAVRSSADGSRVAFQTVGAGSGAEGSHLRTQFLAVRDGASWNARGVIAPMAPDPFATTTDLRLGYHHFADDLTGGLYVQVDGQGGELGLRNLYRRDFETGAITRITPLPLEPLDAYRNIGYTPASAAVTADLSHVVLESGYQLTPDAVVGVTNAYEWADGELRLAGILPDGTTPPFGSLLGRGTATFQASSSGLIQHYTDSTVSPDGSRVFFTAPRSPIYDVTMIGPEGGVGDLYVRENGETTRKVNISQRAVPDPAAPLPSVYAHVAKDGSAVVFGSCEKLTDDSTASCPSGAFADTDKPDLYRWDAETGEILDLSAGLESQRFWGVVGADASAKRVYFGAGMAGHGDMYLWQNGDVTRVAEDVEVDSHWKPSGENAARQAAVSDDGRYMVFRSATPQAGIETGGLQQLMLYDADTDNTRCVSCDAAGAPATASVGLREYETEINYPRPYISRSIDAANKYVFFESEAPLNPGDVNGKKDIYQYEIGSGEVALLSSGRGAYDSYIGDSSADGGSVFFVTREQLVASDRDGLRDVYVARAGGGAPEPASVADCAGDACQGVVGSDGVSGGPRSDGVSEGRPKRPRAVARLRRVSVAVRASLAKRGRGTVTVRVTRPGRVSVTARAKVGHRTRVIARASKRATRAGTVRLTLRLSPTARHELTHRGRLRVMLSTRMTGQSGPQRLTINLNKKGR